MMTGTLGVANGPYFDATLLLTWAFLTFLIGLVVWLRREDKREGYPMLDLRHPGRKVDHFPRMPGVKTYKLLWKPGTAEMPHQYESPKVRARRLRRFAGAPLVPVGDPLLAEVGPGAYPLREDEPLLAEGEPQVVPLRVAKDHRVAEGDTDPRGLPVFDGLGHPVGTVTDLWVDRGVHIPRYLEVTLEIPAAAGRRILLPIYYAEVSGRQKRVRVDALRTAQFAQVPVPADPDRITAREEDRINAFYAGGEFFNRENERGLPEGAEAG